MTDSKPSKSARKREHLDLQELGEQLITLTENQLSAMPLNEDLLAAIHDATRMKTHGALRRQKQLIGSLMRHVNPEPIRAALALCGAETQQDKQIFAAAERWRDRIVSEGSDAIDELNAATGPSDDQLRRLQGDLATTANETVERRLRRQIFRCVHDLLVAQRQDV